MGKGMGKVVWDWGMQMGMGMGIGMGILGMLTHAAFEPILIL
jgi:hypothetical protein